MNAKASEKRLNLLFPQWQGYGEASDIFAGSENIQRYFQGDLTFKTITIDPEKQLHVESGILGYRAIYDQLKLSIKTIASAKPDHILLIGGDCGVEVGPVNYFHQKHQDDFLALWIDAHGDLNTPESSPSQHFHGMPLRHLLGEGDSEILKLCDEPLDPSQVILAGCRDLDPEEARYIARHHIPVYGCSKMFGPEGLLKALKKHPARNIYIHIDLDVLDPVEFPYVICPTPDGLASDVLKLLLGQVADMKNIVGLSLLEFVPRGNDGLHLLSELAHIGTKNW